MGGGITLYLASSQSTGSQNPVSSASLAEMCPAFALSVPKGSCEPRMEAVACSVCLRKLCRELNRLLSHCFHVFTWKDGNSLICLMAHPSCVIKVAERPSELAVPFKSSGWLSLGDGLLSVYFLPICSSLLWRIKLLHYRVSFSDKPKLLIKEHKLCLGKSTAHF